MGGSGWFQVDRGGWKWVIPRPGFLSEWFVRALMYVALNVGLPTVAPADSIKIHVSLSMLLRVERSARCFPRILLSDISKIQTSPPTSTELTNPLPRIE